MTSTSVTSYRKIRTQLCQNTQSSTSTVTPPRKSGEACPCRCPVKEVSTGRCGLGSVLQSVPMCPCLLKATSLHRLGHKVLVERWVQWHLEREGAQGGVRGTEIRRRWEGVWRGGKAVGFRAGWACVDSCGSRLCDVGPPTVTSWGRHRLPRVCEPDEVRETPDM